jgi:hypothetical protein
MSFLPPLQYRSLCADFNFAFPDDMVITTGKASISMGLYENSLIIEDTLMLSIFSCYLYFCDCVTGFQIFSFKMFHDSEE